MRFAIILAIVATLISATSADDDGCPFLCLHDSDCNNCYDNPQCSFLVCCPGVPCTSDC
ncbi:hypothetical protein P692DRAFT_20829044 [Suillus brevipes Sb2]|nr:hypothetical protein P692DRAFT_20829044 [Suillus brevipes Sb2]